MKLMRLLFFIAVTVLWHKTAAAQVVDCPQFPAPCPNTEAINQATNFADREEANLVTPREMAMEANLRSIFTDILQKLSRQKHWQVYELIESQNDRPNGSVSFPKWRATPYEKRPPHSYLISFIIIVNKDSLQAWRDWYNGDFNQQANQVVADIKSDGENSSNDQLLQSLTDSVQYYALLSGKYIQDHYGEFMTAVQNNDQKGQKRYNDKVAEYQKKQDALMKRMQDQASGLNRTSTNSYNRFASEKVNKTEAFINASLVLVHFAINTERAEFSLPGDDNKRITPQKLLNVPGAVYAGLLHNPSPPNGQSYHIDEQDYGYNHPSNMAIVLFGKWQMKPDAYGYIPADYTAGKTATNLVTIKNIKCDTVQNMMMQIEGRPDYIRQVLNEIDVNALKKVIPASF